MASLLLPSLPRASYAYPSVLIDEKHQFLGQAKDLNSRAPRLSPSKPPRWRVRAQKIDLWQLFGGRGLARGEEGLIMELEKKIPSGQSPNLAGQEHNEEEEEENSAKPVNSATPLSIDEKAFDKEMMGMTGGFPGGEIGVMKFLEKNPPPPPSMKVSPELENLMGSLAKPNAKPKAPPLPLLLPGMIVIVKNPKHPYHMFTGIVQRVTDGKAGVLFEGGNWDKLISFELEDLERRTKGPPMSNPKSAVLETRNNP